MGNPQSLRKHKHFHIRGGDGIYRNIDLERSRYRKILLYTYHPILAELKTLIIPYERHKDDICRNAKQAELKKLEDLEGFRIVNNSGQDRTSCKWILWTEGHKVRARVCMQDFDKDE